MIPQLRQPQEKQEALTKDVGFSLQVVARESRAA
jgi:hypothetical protein